MKMKEQYDPQMRYMEDELNDGLSICEEAEALVSGQRQMDYDTPVKNHTRIGIIWGVILETDPVPPHIVSLMMAGVKIARQIYRPSRDNMVDLAGYAQVTQMCLDETRNENDGHS